MKSENNNKKVIKIIPGINNRKREEIAWYLIEPQIKNNSRD